MSSTNHLPVITIEATIQAPIEKVWKYWTEPEHIINWNNASPDWHTPHAENDLREGGIFKNTMAAKDGSMQFDFEGTYTLVKQHETIAYTLGDSRTVQINFNTTEAGVHVLQRFEAETQNSIELQKTGWQAILNSFKTYSEKN